MSLVGTCHQYVEVHLADKHINIFIHSYLIDIANRLHKACPVSRIQDRSDTWLVFPDAFIVLDGDHQIVPKFFCTSKKLDMPYMQQVKNTESQYNHT